MLRIYNTLNRKIEDFKPLIQNHVGMYTCGPTVYDFAHIGNFRTYTTADLLYRVFLFNDYNVKYVMNLTDVGHLTGDNLGDADTGEDRMEKSAKKQGKSVWDVAKFYTDAFFKDFERLNLKKPFVFAKATDHIKEQIELVKTLEDKGYTYKTSDGIYFDTSKFPEYGKLSNLDQIKEGARVEINPEKKNPTDFALWKFSPQDEKRQMEWKSPWGVGFPGWHIECSAMAMKYLGTTFDIHTGGIDLSSTHHPNEIAQSEAATDHPFVMYWVHGAFILIEGKRMSKSMGNNYLVQDVIEKGFDPLALRYLYLQTHYRQEMNFTWNALKAAQTALVKLKQELGKETGTVIPEYQKRFAEAVNDDMNMAKALAIMWELMKSDESTADKTATVRLFDEVFGLELFTQKEVTIPAPVLALVEKRKQYKAEKNYAKSDELRDEILGLGYEVLDEEHGEVRVKKLITHTS